ncbi:MAG: prepilin-type N-terminal cleavage/methylation domain-containing protein [Planctomycetes bacterium]|nr:prepilin-type N-terminal cleavage/methylation domain-containing protein [Planctomycetota bacterium]
MRTRRNAGLGRRSAKREGGFTLLEVMLALAIVAGTVFALLYMRTKAILRVTEARRLRSEWSLVQQKVGEYEEVLIDDVKEGTESGTYEDDTTATWERTTEKVTMDMIEKVDDDHPREMWRITLKVNQRLSDGTVVTTSAQWYRLLKEDDAAPEAGGGGGGGGGR